MEGEKMIGWVEHLAYQFIISGEAPEIAIDKAEEAVKIVEKYCERKMKEKNEQIDKYYSAVVKKLGRSFYDLYESGVNKQRVDDLFDKTVVEVNKKLYGDSKDDVAPMIGIFDVLPILRKKYG